MRASDLGRSTFRDDPNDAAVRGGGCSLHSGEQAVMVFSQCPPAEAIGANRVFASGFRVHFRRPDNPYDGKDRDTSHSWRPRAAVVANLAIGGLADVVVEASAPETEATGGILPFMRVRSPRPRRGAVQNVAQVLRCGRRSARRTYRPRIKPAGLDLIVLSFNS